MSSAYKSAGLMKRTAISLCNLNNYTMIHPGQRCYGHGGLVYVHNQFKWSHTISQILHKLQMARNSKALKFLTIDRIQNIYNM